MIYLYLIALLPIAVGAFFWYKSSSVVWGEWLAGSILALVTCGVIHAIAVRAQTHDVETWSGRVESLRHEPEWVEEYQVAVYTADSKGNQHFSHYETHHRTHPERWMARTSLWDFEHDIGRARFNQIAQSWGNLHPVRGDRPGYDSGDRNDYVATYDGKTVWPITDLRSWSNRLKAAPSVFDFVKVTPEQAAELGLYEWPRNPDIWQSGRLLGDNGKMTIRALDLVNTRIGPMKEANLIFIGFGNLPQSTAAYQQAYWVGGKKNDVVICHGTDWAYAFGWAYDNTVFRDLETAVLNYKLDHGTLDDGVLDEVTTTIIKSYQRKHWEDFDYISVTPPGWAYLVLIVIMAAGQTAFWIYAHRNEFDKDGYSRRHLYSSQPRSRTTYHWR